MSATAETQPRDTRPILLTAIGRDPHMTVDRITPTMVGAYPSSTITITLHAGRGNTAIEIASTATGDDAEAAAGWHALQRLVNFPACNRMRLVREEWQRQRDGTWEKLGGRSST